MSRPSAAGSKVWKDSLKLGAMTWWPKEQVLLQFFFHVSRYSVG